MKTIKIFVAGAKMLVEERKLLREMAHDLNKSYMKSNLSISVETYESMEDSQAVYDAYIENEADLFILLIKDHLGDITKQEFLKASAMLHKEKHPEILVFVHSSMENSENVSKKAELEQLMSEQLGERYWTSYTNLEGLKYEFHKRLDRFVEKRSKSWLSRIKIPVLITSLVLLGSVATYLHFHKPSTLLFVGGGSVCDYIKEYYGEDIAPDSLPNSIYLHTPSQNAYSVIANTGNNNHSKINFFPIVLSAQKATTQDFRKERDPETFLRHKCIVEFCIGSDTLMAYFLNYKAKTIGCDTLEFYAKKNGKDKLKTKQTKIIDVITKEELALCLDKFLTNNQEGLYLTNSTSGTRMAYKSFLKRLNEVDEDKVKSFTQEQAISDTLTSPCLLLGSYVFFPHQLNETSDVQYCFIADSSGDYYKKPTYLYFEAFAIEKNNVVKYKIPNEVQDYLEKLVSRTNNEEVKKQWDYLVDENWELSKQSLKKKEVIVSLEEIAKDKKDSKK